MLDYSTFTSELIEYLENRARDSRRDMADPESPETQRTFDNGEAWAYEAILAWVRRAIGER